MAGSTAIEMLYLIDGSIPVTEAIVALDHQLTAEAGGGRPK